MYIVKKKRFSQVFLKDKDLSRRIVELFQINKEDNIIEVGPGSGSITDYILKKNFRKSLTAIEIDKELVHLLKKKYALSKSIDICQGDFLDYDLRNFYNGKLITLVGNIPYNISSKILVHIIKFKKILKTVFFMLQEELAEKIVSPPGSKKYCRLSVLMQYHFHCRSHLIVPSQAFHPKPKINSKIISLTPRKEIIHHLNDYVLFKEVIKKSFSQRRKKIYNNLKVILNIKNNNVVFPINMNLRAESLSVKEFIILSNFIKDFNNE